MGTAVVIAAMLTMMFSENIFEYFEKREEIRIARKASRDSNFGRADKPPRKK